MLANSFFELLGKLFENVLFIPYNLFRLDVKSWWGSNAVNWFIILLGVIAFMYWMRQMYQYKKLGKEDEA